MDRSKVEPGMDEARVIQLIDRWDARDRPIHCANCRHALVTGTPRMPVVRCEEGVKDGYIRLVALIRPKRPSCFKTADACPFFESMGG